MSDDAELLRRYAETRSEPAFATLVERHLGLVYAAALRRLEGDTHRATEVAQTVFIALARQAPTLAHRPVLASWLHTATRHAALDLRRSEHRQRTRDHQFLVTGTVNAPAPSDAPADWEKLRPLLDAALDQLNESDRTLLLLRFFEQHAFTDIGAKLHLTEDAARMRTARALEKLRTHLSRHGITSTATALGTALTTQTLTAAPAGLATAITAGALAGTAALTALNLTVMTTTAKTLLTAAAVAILGLSAALFFQSRQAQETALTLAASQQTADTLRAENAALTARFATAKAITPPSAISPTTPAASVAPTPNTNAGYNYGFWAISGYGPAFVQQQLASLRIKYGKLYRELNLTPEEIAEFEKAQTEKFESDADLYSNAVTQGLNPGSPSVAKLALESSNTLQRTLAAALGDARYAQYQQYEKNGMARGYALAVASYTYDTPTPLAASQGAALEKFLTANIVSKSVLVQDGNKTSVSTQYETDWPAVFAQAQGVLSPVQLATLQQLAERDRTARQLQQIQFPVKK